MATAADASAAAPPPASSGAAAGTLTRKRGRAQFERGADAAVVANAAPDERPAASDGIAGDGVPATDDDADAAVASRRPPAKRRFTSVITTRARRHSGGSGAVTASSRKAVALALAPLSDGEAAAAAAAGGVNAAFDATPADGVDPAGASTGRGDSDGDGEAARSRASSEASEYVEKPAARKQTMRPTPGPAGRTSSRFIRASLTVMAGESLAARILRDQEADNDGAIDWFAEAVAGASGTALRPHGNAVEATLHYHYQLPLDAGGSAGTAAAATLPQALSEHVLQASSPLTAPYLAGNGYAGTTPTMLHMAGPSPPPTAALDHVPPIPTPSTLAGQSSGAGPGGHTAARSVLTPSPSWRELAPSVGGGEGGGGGSSESDAAPAPADAASAPTSAAAGSAATALEALALASAEAMAVADTGPGVTTRAATLGTTSRLATRMRFSTNTVMPWRTGEPASSGTVQTMLTPAMIQARYPPNSLLPLPGPQINAGPKRGRPRKYAEGFDAANNRAEQTAISGVYRITYKSGMQVWRVTVYHRGRNHYLGTYNSEIAAANAHDRGVMLFALATDPSSVPAALLKMVRPVMVDPALPLRAQLRMLPRYLFSEAEDIEAMLMEPETRTATSQRDVSLAVARAMTVARQAQAEAEVLKHAAVEEQAQNSRRAARQLAAAVHAAGEAGFDADGEAPAADGEPARAKRVPAKKWRKGADGVEELVSDGSGAASYARLLGSLHHRVTRPKKAAKAPRRGKHRGSHHTSPKRSIASMAVRIAGSDDVFDDVDEALPEALDGIDGDEARDAADADSDAAAMDEDETGAAAAALISRRHWSGSRRVPVEPESGLAALADVDDEPEANGAPLVTSDPVGEVAALSGQLSPVDVGGHTDDIGGDERGEGLAAIRATSGGDASIHSSDINTGAEVLASLASTRAGLTKPQPHKGAGRRGSTKHEPSAWVAQEPEHGAAPDSFGRSASGASAFTSASATSEPSPTASAASAPAPAAPAPAAFPLDPATFAQLLQSGGMQLMMMPMMGGYPMAMAMPMQMQMPVPGTMPAAAAAAGGVTADAQADGAAAAAMNEGAGGAPPLGGAFPSSMPSMWPAMMAAWPLAAQMASAALMSGGGGGVLGGFSFVPSTMRASSLDSVVGNGFRAATGPANEAGLRLPTFESAPWMGRSSSQFTDLSSASSGGHGSDTTASTAAQTSGSTATASAHAVPDAARYYMGAPMPIPVPVPMMMPPAAAGAFDWRAYFAAHSMRPGTAAAAATPGEEAAKIAAPSIGGPDDGGAGGSVVPAAAAAATTPSVPPPASVLPFLAAAAPPSDAGSRSNHSSPGWSSSSSLTLGARAARPGGHPRTKYVPHNAQAAGGGGGTGAAAAHDSSGAASHDDAFDDLDL